MGEGGQNRLDQDIGRIPTATTCTKTDHVAHCCSITGRESPGRIGYRVCTMHGMHLFVLLLLVSAPLHAGNMIARAYSDFIHNLVYSVTTTHRDMVGTELESKHVISNHQHVTSRKLFQPQGALDRCDYCCNKVLGCCFRIIVYPIF